MTPGAIKMAEIHKFTYLFDAPRHCVRPLYEGHAAALLEMESHRIGKNAIFGNRGTEILEGKLKLREG